MSDIKNIAWVNVDPSNEELYRRVINHLRSNVDFDQIPTAEDALEKISQNQYDVVVVGPLMPFSSERSLAEGKNNYYDQGVDLVREIRSTVGYEQTPILTLGVMPTEAGSLTERLLQAGANEVFDSTDFNSKGCSPSHFSKVLSKYL